MNASAQDQNENQKHQDSFSFLDQIAITDRKKQRRFFSRHQLNFNAQPGLRKKSKIMNRLTMGILGLSLVAATMTMGVLHLNRQYSQRTAMMDLGDIASNSISYAPYVGRDYSMNNKMAEEKIAKELHHIVAHPQVDAKGHLYVDNNRIKSLLDDFYAISENSHQLDYQGYFYMLSDMDSNLIDHQIKAEFAYKGMTALIINYKTSILARDYYLSHLSKWNFWQHASTQAYQDQFDEDYFSLHEEFFKFFAQTNSGVTYTYSLEDNELDLEEQTFWNMVKPK
jgi:hypothetical protein